MKRRAVAYLVIIVLGSSCGAILPTASNGAEVKIAFSEGQLWSLKGNAQLVGKVVIGRIERWNEKVAIHISVLDIFPRPKGSHSVRIDHMPFEEKALASSVDLLLETGIAPASNFDAGYRQWAADRGGIYTIGVLEAIKQVFGSSIPAE